MSEDSLPLRKVFTAQNKGADGVLIVSDVHNHPEPENFQALVHSLWPEKPPRIPSYMLRHWVEQVHIPAFLVSRRLARTLLDIEEGPFEELARSSEKPLGRKDAATGSRVKLFTDLTHHTVADRNVVAAIEGCDPKLKDEWVIISCHLDHNGADGNQVYNGADDNGSGVVGML